MTKANPDIRPMRNGDIVVDYGAVWFRVRTDGAVVKKTASAAGIETTLADRKEAEQVRNDLKKWTTE
ncbi:hypothetical protein [Bradyrhizobium sp. USDA 4350]